MSTPRPRRRSARETQSSETNTPIGDQSLTVSYQNPVFKRRQLINIKFSSIAFLAMRGTLSRLADSQRQPHLETGLCHGIHHEAAVPQPPRRPMGSAQCSDAQRIHRGMNGGKVGEYSGSRLLMFFGIWGEVCLPLFICDVYLRYNSSNG